MEYEYIIHHIFICLFICPVCEENAIRASLDAPIATDAGFRILEYSMFVPQKDYFADYIFRTFLDTLPARRTSARVHGYIIRPDSIHAAKVRKSYGRAVERTMKRLARDGKISYFCALNCNAP